MTKQQNIGFEGGGGGGVFQRQTLIVSCPFNSRKGQR